MESLEIAKLTFTYPGQDTPAVSDVELTVSRGEFVALCGPSGSGKSTLLRMLKPAIAPRGEKQGDVLFDGRPVGLLSQLEQTAALGFVGQSPENQLVTDKVWHELAFGLESLGVKTPEIRRRVAEMAAFFGMEDWFYRDAAELSGGQKQILNLASVMVMQPELLILDEPTSRLDPVAAGELIAVIGRINRELGTAVIIAEHRLEEVLPLAHRAAVLEGGRLVCVDAPAAVGERLLAENPGVFLSMPAPMRIWSAVENELPCPVTAAEGAKWLREYAAGHELLPLPPEKETVFSGEPAASADGVWFRYEKNAPDVLKGFDAAVYPGEILALLGGNGAGKSTALSVLAGIQKPYRGRVRLRGRAALLPQEPQLLFAKNTVYAELESALKAEKLTAEEQGERIGAVCALCRLEGLLSRHPYDLSGGELQRAALARVLLSRPDTLLLDEPTKGMDAEFKLAFGGILNHLAAGGTAIIMVSHDTEFCAAHANRCAMLFDGMITAEASPRKFFSDNYFYTTSASRMARGLLPEAVTPEDVAAACGGRLKKASGNDRGGSNAAFAPAGYAAPEKHRSGLPVWRAVPAGILALAAIWFLAGILRQTDFASLFSGGGISFYGMKNIGGYAGLIFSLMGLSACVGRRGGGRDAAAAPKKISGRALAAAGVMLVLVPATVLAGVYFFGDRKYYFISLAVLFEITVPFLAAFEGRAPQARELAIVAVLCAAAAAGRAAFFMLPSFKPVLAVVIISGAAFGGETGFLVGAVTMLVSNILFGQGPWTPWQMLGMGAAGLAAGVLFGGGFFRADRSSLCVFGALAAVFLYGPILNFASVLIWQPSFTWQMVAAAFVTGLPFDLVHASATVIFLWLGAEPLLQKLDRMKTKYGLMAA